MTTSDECHIKTVQGQTEPEIQNESRNSLSTESRPISLDDIRQDYNVDNFYICKLLIIVHSA